MTTTRYSTERACNCTRDALIAAIIAARLDDPTLLDFFLHARARVITPLLPLVLVAITCETHSTPDLRRVPRNARGD